MIVKKKFDKRSLPTYPVKCEECGVNLHSKPHKKGCSLDSYGDFRAANYKKYKKFQEGTIKPIEMLMFRQPSSDMEIRCLVCGCAHNEKGDPFESWEEADNCCGDVYSIEFREEVERRLADDWKRQQKCKRRSKKDNNHTR